APHPTQGAHCLMRRLTRLIRPTSRCENVGQPQTLTFIPWFSWANRGEGEMRIWMNEEKHCHP
ncbi:hypothetical protein, partial [Escherichia sp. MOD1-EC7003]|uniref:hypothetical protein n=1 Tax=Escherichia sp. MOD1-EC7003 TaxID=2093900 RepID=UPI001A7E1835